MKVIKKVKQIICSLENSKIPFIYFILTFFFATTLRNFLESLLDHTQISLFAYLHYYLSYIALAMSLILLFRIITKTDILKIAKVILPSFIILNLVPILDSILSLGKGYQISYINPLNNPNLVLRFFTFFGDFSGSGITPGMRIEIAIALLGSFIYFYSKNQNLIKSLFYSILTYALIFSYLAIPSLLYFFAEYTSKLLPLAQEIFFLNPTDLYLFIIFFIGVFLAYLTNKRFFEIIIRDIRPFRLAHYELMFFLGLILGIKYGSIFRFNKTFIIFIPISIALAWLFSVITNNIEDYEIDKISNKKRPLINNKINPEAYKKLKWPLLFAALIYAGGVNFTAFFIILLFIGNYFLYSIPPLRLKRITFFSKLIISINSLILVILGFMLITNSELHKLNEFPNEIYPIFLIFFTAATNFIDIKDYNGDKKVGIKTLPVVLGLEKSKFIIGLFFVLAYLSVYLIIDNVYLVPILLTFGIAQFYLINKKNYKEKYVFSVYLVSLIILLIYLIFKL